MARNIQTGRTYTSDYEKSRAQDFVAQATQNILSRVGVKDYSVVDATITTSDTAINHGLGRVPMGYMIIDRNAAQTVYTSSSTNQKPTLQLILKASGTVTVKVMVF